MDKSAYEKYIREEYSMAEKMYKNYIEIIKSYQEHENMKYTDMQIPIDSKEFKRGFICGIKLMSSIIDDL